MFLIDSHTHLYLNDFKDDIDFLIKSAINNNIKKFLLPNIDTQTLKPLLELTHLYPENCFPMIGLHPCSIDHDFEKNLQELESKICENRFIAIGEIGIDLYWDQTFLKEQKIAFEKQLNWAKKYNLPIAIHSRNSFDEIYSILKKQKYNDLKGVFHCFTGDLKQAKKIIDLGLFLGIGGVLTFKNSKLDEVIKKISIKHLLIETDAPYLSPSPHRGKRNKPEFLSIIANKICELKNISLSELTNNLYLNTNSLFFDEKS
jgi:TatD DNase family protein